MKNHFLRLLLATGFFLVGPFSLAQDKGKGKTAAAPEPLKLSADWVKHFIWRSIGPANMGGRITAISVYEADPSIFYVATASGGLLKTTNNGTTFEHQFDREATVSIGDVCVAPSNPQVVWVGTGENNPRNSVSYGDGVYKSTDGGKSWKNMGLKETFQIGKILIHPTNPDIVYVGALGRLYGPNKERGLFKTMDGGKTWEHVFFLDENTGIIDMRMHPADPDTLLLAAWERRRNEFDTMLGGTAPKGHDAYDPSIKWGPNSGIYKTVDGGKNFKRMTTGLPTCQMGRIGLDWQRKDPSIVYAIIDTEKVGMGLPPKKVIARPYLGIQGEDAMPGVRLTLVSPEGPAAKAGLMLGDVIMALNKIEIKNYAQLLEEIGKFNPGDKVNLAIKAEPKPRVVEVVLGARTVKKEGGKEGPPSDKDKKERPYLGLIGGQVGNMQDQQGPDGHEYGGVFQSSDGGNSWTRLNSLNPRPMYFSQVRVDPSDPKYVYVLGIQQHRSVDGGKKFDDSGGKGVHADGHALWIDPKDGRHMIIGTDGGLYVTWDRAGAWDHLNHMALGQFYHVAVSTKTPYWVFGGLQDNGTWGGPSVGSRGGIGPINEDWLSVGGGDGFMCQVDPTDPDLVYGAIQDGRLYRRHLKTGAGAAIRPAQQKGKPGHRFNWNTPFILSRHNPKIYYCAGEVVFRSVKQGEDLKIISPDITRTKGGTGTALAESPKNAEVLWVGTDDGHLWVTRDGGLKWNNVAAKVGLPGPRWVATIEASRFAEGRAFVCFDAHRSNDDKPYVYSTEDFGETWQPLMEGLPEGSTRCLREDVSNPDLLYLGTEFSVFVALDRGKSWTRVNNNLPTVAVHEIAVHPTAGEIVAATHGRSLWILDVTALRSMRPETVKAAAHLYPPNTAVRWRTGPATGSTNRRFIGTNPASVAPFYYSLADKAEEVSVKVVDISGTVMVELKAPGAPGLHKVTWDMTRPVPVKAPDKKPDEKPPEKMTGKGPPPPPRLLVPPGTYRVILSVNGHEQGHNLRVEVLFASDGMAATEEEELMFEDD